MKPINFYWRLVATGLSFSTFGLGAVSITIAVFPIIHLLSFSRRRANRGCQYVVHLTFRFFVGMLNLLGVLTHEITGAEKLMNGADRSAGTLDGIPGGKLIVANHPTLLDIVFLVSLLPSALCVVKKSAWSNPFLAGLMWATGYIRSDDPFDFIQNCVQAIEQGNNLLIFPEATRSVPGQPMNLKRAAASVIAESGRSFVLVIITCDPPTLSKGQKWYEIPGQKMHFKITVGDSIDPRPFIIDGEPLSKTNRRINALIEKLFLAGIEEHGRPG